MIAHLVLFNPKAGVGEVELRSFARAIADACRTIPTIRRSQIGKRIEFDAGYARSFGDQTYRYVAIFEFDNADALRQYLTHPTHRQLGRLFWEICDSTIVIEAAMTDGLADGLVEFLLKDQ